MEEAAILVIVCLFGLAALAILLGWIVPLILGGVGRRRHWPSAGIWRGVGIAWACLALLLALAAGFAIFCAAQASRRYRVPDAAAFSPANHPGPTATLRLARTGDLECVFQDEAGGSIRCVASNGALVVPAGALTLREIKSSTTDAAGIPWTAASRSWNSPPLNLGAGAVTNAGFGPPFLLAVQVEYAPVSSSIRLAPVCADREGNAYQVADSARAAAPSFQFLEAGGRVLWSGKFEAG